MDYQETATERLVRLHPRRLALAAVERERERQDAKWGEQNHEDGLEDFSSQWTAPVPTGQVIEAYARMLLENRNTYAAILMEEVGEALQAKTPEDLRTELVQVAAVACAWVECTDRRADTKEG